MKKFYSLLTGVAVAMSANAQIVISQVYGAGGNAGATFKNDFIELFNKGNAPVTLTGAYLQYASATGNFNIKHSLPSITIPAGGYYLIKEAGGTTGTDIPTADYTPPSTGSDGWLNMSGTAGKIALTKDNAAPTIGGTNIVDYISFGTTATPFQGSGPTPAPSSTNSIFRKSGGCVNTNDNSADFEAAAASPRNSSTAVNVCTVLNVTDIKDNKTLVKNTVVSNEIIFGQAAKVSVINMNGQVVKTADVAENAKLNVSDLSKGMYVVTAVVNGKTVSQKIVKK